MIVTEDQAKTKWCQEVRATRSDADVSGNRDRNGGIDHVKYMCIASRCMAWRWVLKKVPNDHPLIDDATVPSTTHGYCGKAGVP